jgi:hypothetical protein
MDPTLLLAVAFAAEPEVKTTKDGATRISFADESLVVIADDKGVSAFVTPTCKVFWNGVDKPPEVGSTVKGSGKDGSKGKLTLQTDRGELLLNCAGGGEAKLVFTDDATTIKSGDASVRVTPSGLTARSGDEVIKVEGTYYVDTPDKQAMNGFKIDVVDQRSAEPVKLKR